MKHTLSLAAAALSLLLAASPASAVVTVYNVTLSGGQSNPVNASTATGSATVTVDDVANTVAVTMSWSGLTGGAPTAAHIHCCAAPPGNVGVIIGFTSFPAATSGTYTNTFTGISTGNITGINNGLAYINIHNAGFPGGEIRGNILAAAVPEAGTSALMLAGLAGLGAFSRARQRRRA